jgi:hydrogenase nickel incorporation protein HypA/HybF
MHELSVTESILAIALRHAEASKASRITDLYLIIGRLSSIIDDSVQFYWEIVSKGTIAEGSRLHFQRIPVCLHCLDCDFRYSPSGEDLSCPICQGIQVRILTGEEFQLESIEVETAELTEAEMGSIAKDAGR